MKPSPAGVSVADPRRPLVLDTRPLGRRPGSMWEGVLQAPAPAGLGGELITVPPGAPLELDLRLESVLDGVLVTATVTAPTAAECARCLDPVADEIAVPFTELFSYPEQADRHGRLTGEAESDDGEVQHLDGDLLDLEQSLRDAVVLALPTSPLCDPECGGLCATCGIRLDDAGPEHGHTPVDARWAALQGLVGSPAADPVTGSPHDPAH